MPYSFNKAELRSCADAGMTMTQAAQRLGCSVTPVHNWAAEWGIKFADGRKLAAKKRDLRRKVSMKEALEVLSGGGTAEGLVQRFGVPRHRAIFAESLHKERAARAHLIGST